jgi:hypothetical protein
LTISADNQLGQHWVLDLTQLPHYFGQLGEDRYRKSFILFKGLL